MWALTFSFGHDNLTRHMVRTKDESPVRRVGYENIVNVLDEDDHGLFFDAARHREEMLACQAHTGGMGDLVVRVDEHVVLQVDGDEGAARTRLPWRFFLDDCQLHGHFGCFSPFGCFNPFGRLVPFGCFKPFERLTPLERLVPFGRFKPFERLTPP